MGNPNPSPSTRFGAKNGNPIAGGKSKKQRKAEYRAAEDAAELRAKMLSIIKEETQDGGNNLLDYLRPEVLKLFKDSEDRAHGTPQASTVLMGDENAPLKIERIERSIVKASN